MGSQYCTAGQENWRYCERSAQKCRRPEGDDHGLRADFTPHLIHGRKAPAAALAGASQKQRRRVHHPIVIQLTTKARRISRMMSAPATAVIDEISMAGEQGMARIAPGGAVVDGQIDSQFVGNLKAAHPDGDGDEHWDHEKDGEDIENESHR